MTKIEKTEWIDYKEQIKNNWVENLFIPNKVNIILWKKQLIELLFYVKQYPKIIIDFLWNNLDDDFIITEVDIDINNDVTFTYVEYFDIEEKEKTSSIIINNDKISEIAKRVETHKFLLNK